MYLLFLQDRCIPHCTSLFCFLQYKDESCTSASSFSEGSQDETLDNEKPKHTKHTYFLFSSEIKSHSTVLYFFVVFIVIREITSHINYTPLASIIVTVCPPVPRLPAARRPPPPGSPPSARDGPARPRPVGAMGSIGPMAPWDGPVGPRAAWKN